MDCASARPKGITNVATVASAKQELRQAADDNAISTVCPGEKNGAENAEKGQILPYSGLAFAPKGLDHARAAVAARRAYRGATTIRTAGKGNCCPK